MSWADEQRRGNTDLAATLERPQPKALAPRAGGLTVQPQWHRSGQASRARPENGCRRQLRWRTQSDAYQNTPYFRVSGPSWPLLKNISSRASENRPLNARTSLNIGSVREASARRLFNLARFSGSPTNPKNSSYAENNFSAIAAFMPYSFTAIATMSRGVWRTYCRI